MVRNKLKLFVLLVVLINILSTSVFTKGLLGANGQTESMLKSVKLVKREKTNKDLLEALDYINTMHPSEVPSYLQIKYPAEILDDYEQRSYLQDTESSVISPLRDIIDSGYTGVAAVGTPPEQLYWIYDTGSSIMFINAFTCNGNHCKTNPQYDHDKSSTYDGSDPKEVSLTYGGGYLKGKLIKDTVWIHNMQVPEQELAEVTDQDEGSTTNFSCLIGLGFPELAPHGELLLFDNIMDHGLLDQNVFTSYYYKDGIHSALDFGSIKPEYYEGEIHYHDVQERFHWNIKIDDIKVNGEPLHLCEKLDGCQGLVDTGTNLNTFEETEYAAIMDKINYDGTCDDLSNYPTLTYVIGGVDYTFEPEEYFITDESDGFKECEPGFFKMNVYNSPEEQPAMVIGVQFMTKYFAIFDRDNDKVGFALASNLEVDTEFTKEVDEIEELTE